MSEQKEEKRKNRKKISNYVICFDKLLGQGAVGQVFLCFHVSNPQQAYAVKIIDKNKFQGDDYLKEAIKRQFEIHSKLKNDHIVELIDMMETVNNIYIIQEYCSGQTLRQVLRENKKLSEDEALFCMKQFCHGYSQLVQKGVIHRDLKPENIMLSGNKLKIGDFGFSKQINTQKQLLNSIVGSPIYMAPQILKGEKYNSKCDVWSFGIILFEMIYGHFPWGANGAINSASALLKKILTEPLIFPSQQPISEKLKNFIEDCLKSDEGQRISWLQIFEHPIFDDQFSSLADQIRKNYIISANLLNKLAADVKASMLIGAFLEFRVKSLDFKLFSKILSWLIPDATEPQLSIMYEMFDKDCNGVIDIEQFVKAFEVCDGNILEFLNCLVEEFNFMYEDLQDEKKVKSIAQKKKYPENVVQQLLSIINSIVLET